MRILHVGWPTSFTEVMTYQDNMLSEHNIRDEHDVLAIFDTYRYVNWESVNGEKEDENYNYC